MVIPSKFSDGMFCMLFDVMFMILALSLSTTWDLAFRKFLTHWYIDSVHFSNVTITSTIERIGCIIIYVIY